jgi:homogentisate 1,2-dioxygenase
MSEFMGLVRGTYDARERGFEPGGISLHNSMVPHGPEAAVHARASAAALAPVRIEDTLAFMFESRYPMAVSAGAMAHSARQHEYPDSWQDLPRHFAP